MIDPCQARPQKNLYAARQYAKEHRKREYASRALLAKRSLGPAREVLRSVEWICPHE